MLPVVWGPRRQALPGAVDGRALRFSVPTTSWVANRVEQSASTSLWVTD